MMLAAVQVHPERLITAQGVSAKRQAELHQLPVKPSASSNLLAALTMLLLMLL